MIRLEYSISVLLIAGSGWAQGQRSIQAGSQSTSGTCSPAVVAGANVTITCQNLDPALATNLHLILKRLNLISTGQLDAKAVMMELNDIKALVAHNSDLSKATVEAGVVGGLEKYAEEQKRQMEEAQNRPRALAQSSYAILSGFLGMLKSMAPILPPTSVQPVSGDSPFMSSFHTRYDITITDTLEKLQSRNIPTGELMTLAKHVNSVADVRRLADGFKQIDYPSAHLVYLQLARFLATVDRPHSAYANLAYNQDQITQQLQARQILIYKNSYSEKIDENLKKLKSQHEAVDALLEIHTHLTTLDDIQRLADGFKKLADSLAP